MRDMSNEPDNEESEATTECRVQPAIEASPGALRVDCREGHTELWHWWGVPDRHVPLTDVRPPPHHDHGVCDRADGRGDACDCRRSLVVGGDR